LTLNTQVLSISTIKQNNTQKLNPYASNNKNTYKNNTPKPQTRLTTPTKTIASIQVVSTNLKLKNNLPKKTHNMRYNQIKIITMAQHTRLKSHTQPKTHKTIHPLHTHHKTQTSKINTQKNKSTHTYIEKYNLTTTTKNPITYKIRIKEITQNNNKIPHYTFYNKIIRLKCGDIESNPGPRHTLLLNHSQIHQERQKTYFFNKTTQIKPEYIHIFELFKPYLNHMQNININQHLTQFCTNNTHCPSSYLFYTILITLARTPTQRNQLIVENSTQWTINLIKNLTESPNPPPTDLHKLQKFHSKNPHITKPLDSIHKELYSFITIERPNLATLQHKLPYLPEKMALKALKCLQPIPNFTLPNPIQNHPPINPQNTPNTNSATKILSWNCGTLNTALPGLQSLTNKPTPSSIIAIQETKLTASKSAKYL
jgi:hypothetical protein